MSEVSGRVHCKYYQVKHLGRLRNRSIFTRTTWAKCVATARIE